jgi:hypothetical protein
MLYRKLTVADVARILGWNYGTVNHYIAQHPDRLFKYVSEWGGRRLISEKALPVLRGLRAEAHGEKENLYASK